MKFLGNSGMAGTQTDAGTGSSPVELTGDDAMAPGSLDVAGFCGQGRRTEEYLFCYLAGANLL